MGENAEKCLGTEGLKSDEKCGIMLKNAENPGKCGKMLKSADVLKNLCVEI